MPEDTKDIIISGRMLKALVRAAETPGLGQGVKVRLLSQLGVDPLMEVDMRGEGEPEPILAPVPLDED